jgi:hypothetical protein
MALGTAATAMHRSLTLDLHFTIVLVWVMVVKIMIVFMGMVWAPDRQRNRDVRGHAVFFSVVTRSGRAAVEGIQTALAPEQARSGRSGIRIIFRLARLVRRKSHLCKLARVDLTEELLVCPASRATLDESVLENALALVDLAWWGSAAIWAVLHRNSRRRSPLGVAVVLLDEAASWRLGWATGEVVEAVSVPSLRSLRWRIVAVGQVVGRLSVATVEARHGSWSLVVAVRASWS